jgi:hypothetical protein
MSKNFWKIFKFTQLLIFIILTAFYISNASAENITIKLNITSGWSMISLPVKPANSTVSYLFPEALVIYNYKKGVGYTRVKENENLVAGKGYWILLDKSITYTMDGHSFHNHIFSINERGWFMIGGCTYPAQASTDNGKIGVIYGYIPGFGYKRILESENLAPGKGYWIYLNDLCQLRITSTESVKNEMDIGPEGGKLVSLDNRVLINIPPEAVEETIY